MAEYVEREAARSVVCDVCEMSGSLYCTYDCKHPIDAIPAADMRPVVRGKWEDVSVRDYSTNINGGMNLSVASMFCPVCKRWHNEVYHYGNPTEMAHYCPNCGARMDGET